MVNQPYTLESCIAGICITDVAMAMNRSTQFVLFRKKERQSGNEMMKRPIISRANMVVVTVSVISTHQRCAGLAVLRSFAELVLIVAVLNAWIERSTATKAIQTIFVFLYHR
jgi:hypothetical protein